MHPFCSVLVAGWQADPRRPNPRPLDAKSGLKLPHSRQIPLQFVIMQRETLPEEEQAYQQALDFLYATINFEEKPADRYQASKLDPSRTVRLLSLFGEPHLQYPTVHIAGTKGKGSVAAMCAAALRACGLRVGLFTSPHLRDVRERIRILTPQDARGWIGKPDFVNLMKRVEEQFAVVPGLTWFEIMTGIAFRYFADQHVDIAVVEVGLGGRLDTTNVLTPLVSVITSLSLDHTALLGDTLAHIAYEKGGIIKEGVPVVCAPQDDEALAVLRGIAAGKASRLILVGDDWRYKGRSRHLNIISSPAGSFVPADTHFLVALAGDHQLENATVALAALDVIKEEVPALTLAAAARGLANVKWEGRLQTVYAAATKPTFVVDAAHNEDSAAKLAAALAADFDYDDLYFIFGAPEDKEIAKMMRLLFPLAKGVIVSAADHPRATSPERLAEIARSLGFVAVPESSPAGALRRAFAQASAADLICACGSIIFIGDLLNQWDGLQSELTLN